MNSLKFNPRAAPMTRQVFSQRYNVETKNLVDDEEDYKITLPSEQIPNDENPPLFVIQLPTAIADTTTSPTLPVVCKPAITSDCSADQPTGNRSSAIASDCSNNQPLFLAGNRMPPTVASQVFGHTASMAVGVTTPNHTTGNWLSAQPLGDSPYADQRWLNLLERLGNDEREWEKEKGTVKRMTLHLNAIEQAVEIQKTTTKAEIQSAVDNMTTNLCASESRTKQYGDKRLSDEVQQLDERVRVLTQKFQRDNCLTNVTGTLLGIVCCVFLYHAFSMMFLMNRSNATQSFYTG